jgi:hypothetical protein
MSMRREEFRKGCDYLNQVLPPDEQLTGIDRLLDLLDFDHSNSIEINEFFEVRGPRHIEGLRNTRVPYRLTPHTVCFDGAGLPSAGPEGRQA